ncbi:MAG: hypothetical protein JJE52_10220 [Acidimicrobiia bacterium]|nr:hypothetical protein [Acidimicrobiia bacterium]
MRFRNDSAVDIEVVAGPEVPDGYLGSGTPPGSWAMAAAAYACGFAES